MATSSTGRGANAKSARPDPKKLLAGALIALLLAALAVFLLTQDESSDTTDRPTVSGPTSQRPPATEASSEGTLTAGGVKLLEVGAGKLGDLAGERVSGRRVTVQSVASGGVWIGTSESARVFAASSSSGFEPGQRVDVSGTVEAAPANAGERFGLEPPGATQLDAAGGYVRADELKPSS